MRRAVALQIGLAVVQALCLAPFQHLHAGHDHHDAVVHSHFFFAGEHEQEAPVAPGPLFDDVDDHSTAKSLDTFTLAFATAVAPMVLARGEVLPPVFVALYEPVEAIDSCAHDPPIVGPSSPRAPPSLPSV